LNTSFGTLACGAGLKSRFSEKLHFPDFTVEDTVQLVRQRLVREYDLTLAPDAEAALPQLAAQVCDKRRCFWCGLLGVAVVNTSMAGQLAFPPAPSLTHNKAVAVYRQLFATHEHEDGQQTSESIRNVFGSTSTAATADAVLPYS
jgi:hypothetical protein